MVKLQGRTIIILRVLTYKTKTCKPKLIMCDYNHQPVTPMKSIGHPQNHAIQSDRGLF